MIARRDRPTMATAVLALATAFTTFPYDTVRAAPAFPDLSTAFDQAHVIHIEGRRYFPGAKGKDGKPLPPVPIDTWIDLENGRLREIAAYPSQTWRLTLFGGRTTTTVDVVEQIWNGPFLMSLDRRTRTVRFTRLSDYGRQWMARQHAQRWRSELCSQPAQLQQFVKSGREEIDGRPYDVWQSGMARQTKLWISADNGRLARVQVLSQGADGILQLEWDYRAIEYDATPPENVFAVEPPAGYKALNAKETARVLELRAGVGVNGLQCDTRVSFTLSDGSVIVAWHSFHPDRAESQEALFANLTFGGPLPKLPVECYGLKSGAVTYAGYHLGSTTKSGRPIEWTLYVPDAAPPSSARQEGYRVLFRLNGVTLSNASMGLAVGYGVPIKTAADFDKWVRGAMIEISDDGTPLAEVTYEKVMDLAQKTRPSTQP